MLPFRWLRLQSHCGFALGDDSASLLSARRRMQFHARLGPDQPVQSERQALILGDFEGEVEGLCDAISEACRGYIAANRTLLR
jgi:hypothetical protein